MKIYICICNKKYFFRKKYTQKSIYHL